MKAFEIEIRAKKMICVIADNEDDALQCAIEECPMEWNDPDVRVEDEYDDEDPDHARYIEEYRKEGELYEAY